MKLHIVGGFLGSGKTTAIIHAAKALMDQGLKVGVITNDQGKYLVDTAFFRLADIPTVEVTGGCFCCNYDDLGGRLSQLVGSSQPDVVFAESVGSCADIVATVVKPLLKLGREEEQPSSFSVFSDARLLRRRLLGQEMPFSEDVVYIFDKQIEEASLVVVNKADLLSSMALDEVQALMRARYPGKSFITQTSLSLAGVLPWLDRLKDDGLMLSTAALDIDYARYGAGEAQLAWLDEEVHLEFSDGQAQQQVLQIIRSLTEAINMKKAGIGHLKFILQSDGGAAKISFPAVEEPGWEASISAIEGNWVDLLVNARVEMPALELKELLNDVLEQSGGTYTQRGEEAFHPGQPNPTHRFA